MRSFVVLGIGSFGFSIATTLHELGHEVLAIDESEDLVDKVAENVTNAVVGDVTDEDTLISLGIKNFDAGIVSIGEDIQSSILVTVLLKELGVKYVIAKARDKMHAKVLSKVGADRVVFVEGEMGIKIAKSLVSKNFFDYIELSGTHSIIEIKVPDNWVDRSIMDTNIRAKYNLNVIAVKRGDDINVSPSAVDVFKKNDILVMLGSNEDINRFNRKVLWERG